MERDNDIPLENWLLRTFYRSTCVDPHLLRDFVWQFLPEKENDEVKRHLQECPLCRQELQELEEIRNGVQSGRSWEEWVEETVTDIKLVFARLIQGDMAGLVLRDKSSSAQAKQSLMLETDDGDLVSVAWQEVEIGRFTLSGQLFTVAPLDQPTSLRLFPQDKQGKVAKSSLDKFGTFQVSDVVPGRYRLVFEITPSHQIHVSILTIQSGV